MLTQLHVLWGVSSMEHSLFSRLQWAFNGHSFNVVADVTGQQIGQHHGRQKVDRVPWLSIDLLCTARNVFVGRLLVWVVLLFYDHAKPARQEETLRMVLSAGETRRKSKNIWPDLPEVELEAVIKVCWLTLPLTAADLSRPLHRGPVDRNLTEEQAQAFRPRLQPPGGQVEGDCQGLARQDWRQHYWFCQNTHAHTNRRIWQKTRK